jgi:hypothetical protein
MVAGHKVLPVVGHIKVVILNVLFRGGKVE